MNRVPESWPTECASIPLMIAAWRPHLRKKSSTSRRSGPLVHRRPLPRPITVLLSMSTPGTSKCGSSTVVVSQPPPAQKNRNFRSKGAATALRG